MSVTALSPDGSLMAAVSGENILEVWNLESGEEVLYLAGQDSVEAMSFSLDGRGLLLALRSARGIVARRLLLYPNDLIAEVCSSVARNLNEQEWADYVGVGRFRPTCPQKLIAALDVEFAAAFAQSAPGAVSNMHAAKYHPPR